MARNHVFFADSSINRQVTYFDIYFLIESMRIKFHVQL